MQVQQKPGKTMKQKTASDVDLLKEAYGIIMRDLNNLAQFATENRQQTMVMASQTSVILKVIVDYLAAKEIINKDEFDELLTHELEQMRQRMSEGPPEAVEEPDDAVQVDAEILGVEEEEITE